MSDEKSPEMPQKKSRRGFAAMDPARQREIAAKGGRQAHKLGVGHIWNREEAIQAGRKGGKISRGGRGKAPEAPEDAQTAEPTDE